MVAGAVTAAAFAAAICAGVAGAQISHVQERELGKRLDMMAAERMPSERDPEFVSCVAEIGQEIVVRLDSSFFDYKFTIIPLHVTPTMYDPTGKYLEFFRYGAFAMPWLALLAGAGLAGVVTACSRRIPGVAFLPAA